MDSNALSLRKLATILGVSQPFLSQIRAGKRPLPDALKKKVEALGAYHWWAGGYHTRRRRSRARCCFRHESSGAGNGIRTHDILLGKQALYP